MTQAQATVQTHLVEKPVRTPIWRRMMALLSLGSLVVIIGIAVAALIAVSALIVLMLLERAAG